MYCPPERHREYILFHAKDAYKKQELWTGTMVFPYVEVYHLQPVQN